MTPPENGALAEEGLEIIRRGPEDKCLKKVHLRLSDALQQINVVFLQCAYLSFQLLDPGGKVFYM
jgi:hypothetical protein